MDEWHLWLGYRNVCYLPVENFNAAVDRTLGFWVRNLNSSSDSLGLMAWIYVLAAYLLNVTKYLTKRKSEMEMFVLLYSLRWDTVVMTEKHSGRNVNVLCPQSQHREQIGSEAGLYDLTLGPEWRIFFNKTSHP